MSECPKIGIQYQRLQDLMTKLDFSLLPSTFDIVKPLTNFVNNESFIKFSERFEKFENNTLINASSELHATLSSLCKMNLCSSTALQNRFSELSKIDFSKMFSASSLLSNIDIAEVLKNSNLIEDYDLESMGTALQRVFNKYSKKQEQDRKSKADTVVSLEMVAEEVQEEYTRIGNANFSVDDSLSEKSNKLTKISIVISIVSLLFSVLFGTTQTILTFLSYKATMDSNSTVMEDTSNFINNEMMIDINILNQLNYRMICRDNVMPRVCHDCKSKVTGHLQKGKVVIIVNHHKKWIEIIWQDKNGMLCSGWIQKYKVTKFK